MNLHAETIRSIREIKPGEALALDPRVVQQSRDAFFWLFGPTALENETIGDVEVVHIRGPLEHHQDPCSDSYEAIAERVQCALEAKPSAVVLRFDTPGGVVAGLNECVDRLRAMSEEADVELVGFVDEMAFSAGYALSCACAKLYLPPSAILGSIGVISTMVDVTAADRMMGIKYVTLTSGARKSDGHPHVPISSDAKAAEMARVEKLADQFFRRVSVARGLDLDTIEGFEAGLFLGSEAVSAGLADGVMRWDDLVVKLSSKKELAQGVPRGPLSKSQSGARRAAEVQLDPFEKDISARIADAKTPRAEAQRLSAALAAYKKSSKKTEEKKKEEDEEEDDEAEAKGNETDRSDDPDNDEDEDEKKNKSKKSKASMKKSEEEASKKSEESEAALSELVRLATGKTGIAAEGALAALLSDHKTLAGRLAALEKQREAETRDSVVNSALLEKRITKKEATTLRGKPQAYVEAFLEARPKALFNGDDDAIPLPKTDAQGNAVLPPDLEAQITRAVTASGGAITREQILATYKADQARMNGRSS